MNTPIDPRLDAIDSSLYRLSVKALIFHDNKILLTREKDDEWWSVPGGGVDYGESLAQALRREVNEELGVPIKSIQTDDEIVYVQIGSIVEGVPKVNIFYRVEVPTDQIRPTADVFKSEWFSKEQINDLYISPSTGGAERLIKIMEDNGQS